MDVRFEIPLGLGSRLAESGSYICPDSRAQLGFGDRRDRIGTYPSRDYECLGVRISHGRVRAASKTDRSRLRGRRRNSVSQSMSYNCWRHSRTDRAGDGPGDVALQSHNIAKVAVVSLCPYVPVLRGSD